MDSMVLLDALVLCATSHSLRLSAIHVHHGISSNADAWASFCAEQCASRGVAFAEYRLDLEREGGQSLEAIARGARYRILTAADADVVALAHHADDQAETFLMRLARGSGVRGLAAMRPRSVAPGTGIKLLRPLLGWRRADLERVCVDAGLTPVRDPSNADDRYERVRIRAALAEAEWLGPAAIARSAANLAEADKALDWAVRLEWDHHVKERRGTILYRPSGAPPEILRRIVSRAVRKLATEGESELRGAELSRLVATLADGGTATLRGVLCRGSAEWQFVPSPNRTRPVDNLE